MIVAPSPGIKIGAAAAEHQNGQAELYAFKNASKCRSCVQKWWGAVEFTTVAHQSCYCIEHWLQT